MFVQTCRSCWKRIREALFPKLMAGQTVLPWRLETLEPSRACESLAFCFSLSKHGSRETFSALRRGVVKSSSEETWRFVPLATAEDGAADGPLKLPQASVSSAARSDRSLVG